MLSIAAIFQTQLAVMGTTEILLIVFAVVLLFGARKLPELARSMGSSVNEFKKGMSNGGKDDTVHTGVEPRAPSSVNGSTKDR